MLTNVTYSVHAKVPNIFGRHRIRKGDLYETEDGHSRDSRSATIEGIT